MKIKIEIKHYITGKVLFEFEKENNTLRDTILEAIKQRADMRYANMSGADMSYANMSGADMRGADMRGADMSDADMSYANMRYANMRGANMSGADMSYANMSYANMRGANMSGADMSDADMSYANMSGANMSGAKNIPTKWLDYWWHVHHEVLVEQLFEPIHNRINYIKSDKPKEEIETRLRLLSPVLGKIPTTKKGWERLHKQECKACPWNGNTIFPKK